jgi:DNA segregation ATPase FtsK/SpoIIIE-like protein
MQNNEDLLQQAMLFAQEVDYISVSSLQRKFLIGYQQANKLLECLIENKICGAELTVSIGYKINR